MLFCNRMCAFILQGFLIKSIVYNSESQTDAQGNDDRSTVMCKNYVDVMHKYHKIYYVDLRKLTHKEYIYFNPCH